MKAEDSLSYLDNSPQPQKFWTSVSHADFLTQVCFPVVSSVHVHTYTHSHSHPVFPGPLPPSQGWPLLCSTGSGHRTEEYFWGRQKENAFSLPDWVDSGGDVIHSTHCLFKKSKWFRSFRISLKTSLFLSSSFSLLCGRERMELIHVLDPSTLNEHTAYAESNVFI